MPVRWRFGCFVGIDLGMVRGVGPGVDPGLYRGSFPGGAARILYPQSTVGRWTDFADVGFELAHFAHCLVV